jgi:nitrite reductase/ring-hydroxylating ferredoxin subunit
MTTARPVEPTSTDAPLPACPAADAGQPGLADCVLSRRGLMRTAAIAGGVVAAGVGLAACSSSSSSSGPTTLAKTSDIPVGGGVIYADHGVVVTQPTAGTFKGFSSTCTHLGCTVDKVANGLIQCPCHGSMYSIVNGSVKAGPAPKPLPAEQISVQHNQVILDS